MLVIAKTLCMGALTGREPEESLRSRPRVTVRPLPPWFQERSRNEVLSGNPSRT
jgi:hypothetical protein